MVELRGEFRCTLLRSVHAARSRLIDVVGDRAVRFQPTDERTVLSAMGRNRRPLFEQIRARIRVPHVHLRILDLAVYRNAGQIRADDSAADRDSRNGRHLNSRRHPVHRQSRVQIRTVWKSDAVPRRERVAIGRDGNVGADPRGD